MNEIRPKGCKHSMRRKRCVTSKWELNPITKPTTIAFLLKTASNFHLPFTVAHTQMEHFLWMRQWACGKYDLLSVDVCESEWQRGVCAQLFSVACHLSEIDGEKCPTRRKPVWCFKAREEKVPFYVFVWVPHIKNNTHITWKGQLGVWMNLSSRMRLRGRLLTVERQ